MKVKIAQIQAHVYEEKSKNLEELERNLKRIKDENIDLVNPGRNVQLPVPDTLFSGLCGNGTGRNLATVKCSCKKIQDLSVSRKCTGKR